VSLYRQSASSPRLRLLLDIRLRAPLRRLAIIMQHLVPLLLLPVPRQARHHTTRRAYNPNRQLAISLSQFSIPS